MTDPKTKTKGWRGSREAWLNVAKDILIDQGESAVTVQAMAKRLKLSRTSFYWFFQDRQDVMQALLDLWADTNTKPIQDASNAYAETMVEAVLNVTYTLISEVEYDPRFDAAFRGSHLISSTLLACTTVYGPAFPYYTLREKIFQPSCETSIPQSKLTVFFTLL